MEGMHYAAGDAATEEGTRYVLKPMDLIALVLVIVGALNWALVGLLEFDLVATITGAEFGETNILSSIVYVLVGLAGVWLLTLLARGMSNEPVRQG